MEPSGSKESDPFRLVELAGRMIVASGPALATGAWLVGLDPPLTVIVISSVPLAPAFGGV